MEPRFKKDGRGGARRRRRLVNRYD